MIPAVWMSTQPWFHLHHLWWLSVTTLLLQATLSYLLLRREFGKRLGALTPRPAT